MFLLTNYVLTWHPPKGRSSNYKAPLLFTNENQFSCQRPLPFFSAPNFLVPPWSLSSASCFSYSYVILTERRGFSSPYETSFGSSELGVFPIAWCDFFSLYMEQGNHSALFPPRFPLVGFFARVCKEGGGPRTFSFLTPKVPLQGPIFRQGP